MFVFLQNSQSANGQVPTEKTIPIQVQHERSRSEPVDGNQNGGALPNERMHFTPDNAYFQHHFQAPFSGSDAANGAAFEPRVHHIPIQVESRNAGSTPMAPRPVPNQQHQANGSHASSQSAPSQANLNQQTNPPVSTFTSSSNNSKPPARTIEIPIQITKSASTPETSKKAENTFQGKASPNPSGPPNVSESASDPAIADPKQVYAMGYEPLPNHATDKLPTPKGEPKKETPFDQVNKVLDDLKTYESQVNEFTGTTTDDKGYRYLDEMLTLCILRLDNINIDGNEELRKYRKSTINDVNRVAAILETKVSKPKPNEETSKEASQQLSDQSQGQSEAQQAVLTQEAEPKNKKDAKKQEKAKAKEEKEKAKKESGEKKEGRRILLFRGKNKNKATANENGSIPATSAATAAAEAMDLDTNNNDLKDAANQSTTSDQNSETASTSSSSTTLQGKETAV